MKHCPCVVKRTGKPCTNRARYSNFFGDTVCGHHTRSKRRPAAKVETQMVSCCAICQNDVEQAAVIDCGHHFHKECLETWIHAGHPASQSCPLCRHTLPPVYEFSLFCKTDKATKKEVLDRVRISLFHE